MNGRLHTCYDNRQDHFGLHELSAMDAPARNYTDSDWFPRNFNIGYVWRVADGRLRLDGSHPFVIFFVTSFIACDLYRSWQYRRLPSVEAVEMLIASHDHRSGKNAHVYASQP